MLDFNPGEHICVVGDARPEKTNPIYLAHEKVILILVVERATGLIVDADTNMVCELTRRFLRSVFVGHSLVDDLEEIRNSLLDNYLGDSKRVLYAAARSARRSSWTAPVRRVNSQHFAMRREVDLSFLPSSSRTH